jgi:hypothetical protein
MPSPSVQFKDFVLDIKCDAPEQEWVAVEVSRVGRDDADSEGRRYATRFKLSELDGLAMEVEGLISESAAPERLAALAKSPPPQTDRSFEKKVEPIGRTLFDKLFPQDSLIRNKLVRDFDSNMRLRLRVSTLLADIPWEIFWAPKDTLMGLIEEGGFLSQETSVVRTPGATGGAEEAHPTDPPLNLLLVADSPSAREQRLLDAQAQRIEEELEESENIKVYRLEMTDRDETTLDAIHRYLRMQNWEVPIHILHFMGHGYYDTNQSPPVGRLLMTHRTDEGREEVAIDEKAVADTIKDGLGNGLRLVVLNGCETGRGRIHFSGVAQALLNEGVPAVLAMQYSISDHLARHLASHFYEGLAGDGSIDEAVRHVRRSLCNHPYRTLEWITPVLFLRGDGELWTFAADEAEGGDDIEVTITGDVSGQVAVGTGITQIQRREETDPLEAVDYVKDAEETLVAQGVAPAEVALIKQAIAVGIFKKRVVEAGEAGKTYRSVIGGVEFRATPGDHYLDDLGRTSRTLRMSKFFEGKWIPLDDATFVREKGLWTSATQLGPRI